MKIKSPSVLISILNWNNYRDTINCVKSVRLLNYDNFEIVIVDNCSRNESVNILNSEFPEINLLKSNENLGYGGGNKLAVDYAQRNNYDLIWLLNNDSIVDPDCLYCMVESYKRNGEAIYGGITLNEEGNVAFGGGFEFKENGSVDYNKYNKYLGMSLKSYKQQIKERIVGDVNGSCMMLPMTLIKKFGFIKTDFFLYAEELDYCFRMRRLHMVKSILVPKAIIYHKSKGASSSNAIIHSIIKYYKRRNWLFFEHNFRNKSKSEIIRDYGGVKSLISLFLMWLRGPSNLNANYMQGLALFHFLLNKKGKTIPPENYI